MIQFPARTGGASFSSRVLQHLQPPERRQPHNTPSAARRKCWRAAWGGANGVSPPLPNPAAALLLELGLEQFKVGLRHRFHLRLGMNKRRDNSPAFTRYDSISPGSVLGAFLNSCYPLPLQERVSLISFQSCRQRRAGQRCQSR